MYKRNFTVLTFLIIAFFISGASALIYQVLWVKQLTLMFGSTTLAVSTILASFMGGLALGSYIMVRKSDKINKVILAYALLEIGIGVYAFILPFLFDLTDIIYRFIWPSVSGIYPILILVRFLLVTTVLIFPTALMGATLPLLVKYYINKDELIVKFVSILYGINTLGAVVGALICGFYLLEKFGLRDTNYIAISLNLFAAFIAVYIDKKFAVTCPESTTNDKIAIKISSLDFRDKIILWSMFLSGFTAMVYEVIWSRQLVLVFGSTTYAYTSMLVIFLVGISLGSLCVNNLFSNNKRNIYYFAIFELAIGLLVIWGTFYYSDIFYMFLAFSRMLHPMFFIVPVLFVSALLIFPAAFLFGVLFPLSIKLFTPTFKSISERTGTIYSFNTLGCILGSFSTGFILIPLIGLKWSIIFAACINILIFGVYLFTSSDNKKVKNISVVVAVLIVLTIALKPADWKKQTLASGIFINNSIKSAFNYDEYNKYLKTMNFVFYKEGQHSTITVSKWTNTETNQTAYSLYNNGKVDASTGFIDMRTQVAISYIPALITNNLDDVLIVGMGSGITAAVIEQFPVKTIELVELEKAVFDATNFFSERYGNPLKDKRLKVVIDDARNYLRVTSKKYDLILSEPSNVWVSGVASLFTKDYYAIVKTKLKPHGILCQWIHFYNLRSEAVVSVIKALKSEFKYVYICHTKTGGDVIFLASQEPIKLDLNLIENKLKSNSLKADLLDLLNISDAYDFLNLFISGDNSIANFLKPFENIIPANSDDNSYLEFKATRDFFLSSVNISKISPLNTFILLKGINKDDILNPPEDFYKRLSIAITTQFNRSASMMNCKESFEYPLYKLQMLVYAQKYNREFPSAADSYDLLGTAFLDNENVKDGIKNMEIAAAKNSPEPETYTILAQYYNKLLFPDQATLKPKQALEVSLKARELEPANLFTIFLVGVSTYNNSNFAEAAKILMNYFNLSNSTNTPVDPRFYEYYSKALLKK